MGTTRKLGARVVADVVPIRPELGWVYSLCCHAPCDGDSVNGPDEPARWVCSECHREVGTWSPCSSYW